MLAFDHIAISAVDLAEGVDCVETALGLRLSGGGEHPLMATHNRLMGLGDLYLEVIAPNPATPRPSWPRWFDLNNFWGNPRLTNWIARSKSLIADLASCPSGTGVPLALRRGDYRWQMAVPSDGKLPYDGAFPALIQWQGLLHPTQALPDSGARLTRLEIAHPKADALKSALSPLFHDPRVVIVTGPVKAMRASFTTPHGVRVLE